jgi:hypothetical protein
MYCSRLVTLRYGLKDCEMDQRRTVLDFLEPNPFIPKIAFNFLPENKYIQDVIVILAGLLWCLLFYPFKSFVDNNIVGVVLMLIVPAIVVGEGNSRYLIASQKAYRANSNRKNKG